nr:PAS domain S-box protein [Desulfobacula sp.]
MARKPTYEALEKRVRELERAGKEHQQMAARYETLVQTTFSGFWIVGADGRILEANEACCSMYGYTQNELPGMHISDIEAAESADETERHIQTIIEQGSDRFLTRHRRKDGSLIDVEISTTYLREDPGRFYSFLEDVTQRLRNEKRFKELAEMMPETIFEIDLQGRLTFINQRAFDLFGAGREEFEKGIHVMDFVHEKDRERVLANMGKILNGENPGVTEYEMCKKNGGSFPALFHSSVILHDGKPDGFRGFLIDMTEKKRTQEILIQNEKMMSIGGLAAGMAHEINNPLAGMIQNAQVVMNRLSMDLPANEKAAAASGTNLKAVKTYMEKREILQMLGHIHSAGRQAAEIVQNMLSFSKMKAPVKSLRALPELVENTIDILQKGYDLKKVKIIRDFDPDLPGVPCEGNKIQQVILNIVKNSMEAAAGPTGRPKDLTLRFRLKNEINWVRLEIEDNGPGMDAGIRKRIFEPFFTTKSVDQGTGLGLSISYFIIVEDHKGEMEVESSPGKGTTFIIRLPV